MINTYAARLAAAVPAAVGVISGIAACSAPASRPHASAAIHRAAAGTGSAASTGGAASKPGAGGAASAAGSCDTPSAPVIGYAGVVRSGEESAVHKALGPAHLAQVTDAGLGTVEVARNPHGLSSADLQTLFSKWSPVRAQSSQSQLRSCHYLLDDKAAAQPLITAAKNAVTSKGLISSADMQQLQMALVSDDPLAPGSVIITLMVPGTAYPNPAPGGPVLHHMAAYTVIENESSAQATGVASGGF